MYRDDLEAALARVEALEIENTDLSARLAGKIPTVVTMPNGEEVLWLPPQDIGPFKAIEGRANHPVFPVDPAKPWIDKNGRDVGLEETSATCRDASGNLIWVWGKDNNS